VGFFCGTMLDFSIYIIILFLITKDFSL